MDIKGFIWGVAVFIVSLILCISFVINLYGEDGYEVDLNADEDTKVLYNLSQNAAGYQTSVSGTTNSIYSGLPGEENASFNPTSTVSSDAQLQMSALSTVSQIKGMLNIFTLMLISMLNLIGLDPTATELYIWILVLFVILPIILILISTVLRNPIS